MMRNGRNDPTVKIDAQNIWRATYTPFGPGTLHITQWDTQTPHVEGFGPGGSWLVDKSHDLLGKSDHFTSLLTLHDEVTRAQQRYGSWRFPRTHTAYHELIPAILGQRVTAIEAFQQWRSLCTNYGSPAPGPHLDLWLPPDPEVLSRVPYYVLHTFGIEKKRADTIRRTASHFHRLAALDATDTTPEKLTSELTQIEGIGVWTAATAGAVAFGDPNALVVGDYHVKNNVAYALTRKPRGTDEQMIALLQPYEGQRGRVVKWLELDGWLAPKFGHRQRIHSIVNR
jgi:3-methyladenine DNA glycosylase/8-oxoguanine DNA glycosylase